MIILGIDTSCDDTSMAVLADGNRVLSNVVHSQVRVHHPHGGVVPELASREHLRNLLPVYREALAKADLREKDLDGIAVTVGPGLVGSLLVGLYFAKALAYTQNIPLIPVNHLEGHILSIFLEEKKPTFPFIALTVSGGHTSLYHAEGIGRYHILGQTLDDAAGEAFDKVAKILGLGYPGGPAIENSSGDGNMTAIDFPRAYLSKDSFDFSFSGLKTAVSLYAKQWEKNEQLRDKTTPADIASSFQESVIDVLVHKVMAARKKLNLSTVVIAGGVACNTRLRRRMSEAVAGGEDDQIFFPRPAYCTDNGAMIALAGYHRLINGAATDLSVDARSKYPIDKLPPMRLCQNRAPQGN